MSDPSEYYQQSRQEMLDFIPGDVRRVIDIGCGEGRFGAAVKQRFPLCETWGVEPMEAAAKQASQTNDRVINSPLENIDDLPSEYFDAVTMNDVLEHLTSSESALRLVRRILRPKGVFIMSLPNVRYYVNVRDLVFRNDWEYRDFGILDRTHFRFFTTKSAVRLLTENGFKVEVIRGLNAPTHRFHYRALFALAPRFFEWMKYPQFAIVARPVCAESPRRD